jgi:hypothetical protein
MTAGADILYVFVGDVLDNISPPLQRVRDVLNLRGSEALAIGQISDNLPGLRG